MENKNVQAFIFDQYNIQLKVLDQTLLPEKINYVDVKSISDGFRVIKNMLVRGAPCIATVGCLCMIVSLNEKLNEFSDMSELRDYLESSAQYLISSRPTAINLSQAINKLLRNTVTGQTDRGELLENMLNYYMKVMINERRLNERLAGYGASEIIINKSSKVNILTHCNTGSLATVGYGTALGVIRTLHNQDCLSRVYCTETRPYNQGSRLTAWELTSEGIPTTLIADNMVAYLFKSHSIDAVVVGADRVAANGDTANKIGTFQIALLANHFNIPFYVAAPSETIDRTCENLDNITIEQRPADELRQIRGIKLAPDDVDVWNPSFDVTPNEYITAIFTEDGVFKQSFKLSV